MHNLVFAFEVGIVPPGITKVLNNIVTVRFSKLGKYFDLSLHQCVDFPNFSKVFLSPVVGISRGAAHTHKERVDGFSVEFGVHGRLDSETDEEAEAEKASQVRQSFQRLEIHLSNTLQAVENTGWKFHRMLFDEADHHVVRYLGLHIEAGFQEGAIVGEVAQKFDPSELRRVKIGIVEVLILRPERISLTQHHHHFVRLRHFSKINNLNLY